MRLLLLLALALTPIDALAQLRGAEYLAGFDRPLAFVPDPVDTSIHYVIEQPGRVRIVVSGVVRSQSFLDLTAVITTAGAGGERGLLGLAFAPDYSTSRRFYVFFTNAEGNLVISRFRRSAGDPFVADAASRFDLRLGTSGARFILHTGPGYGANHNGGCLQFGPDGFLYVAIGDGGGAGDQDHHAQNPALLVGKLLRIDVNVADSNADGYVVPASNPFVTNSIGARTEIWAFGLRNPWRFTFDAPSLGGTGAMLIGDVGQNAREEVDYQPAGMGGINWGWRNREGTTVFNNSLPPAYSPLRDPIHEYDHTGGGGRSITGGYVYRGNALPVSIRGRYFFADFIAGRVWSFALAQSGGVGTPSDLREHTEELGGQAFLGNISSFGVDAAGELYIASYSRGRILRVLPGCGYQLSPSSRIVTSSGARLTVSLSTGDGCTWSASTPPSWITVSPSSGSGSATLTVDVAADASGAGRVGSFTIQGVTFTVTQAPRLRPQGDFDGDGRLDLLLRHETEGLIGVWLMNGTTLRDGRLFAPDRVTDTQWTIVGSADMNGDGQPDLVWQHDDGFLAAWFMNGTTRLDVVFMTPNRLPHRDWRVVAVTDINGDGHADLVLQHRTDRVIGAWLMNGTTFVDGVLMTPSRTMDAGWDVMGAADVDGDGASDLVLQHASDGLLGVWFMRGTTLVDGRLLSRALPDRDWRVRAVGDLDGDGHPDLVLQHEGNRMFGAWLLDGTTVLDGRLLSPASLSDRAWRIVGPR